MDNPALRWSAYEHDHIERGSDWYWALGVVAISIAITAIILHDLLLGRRRARRSPSPFGRYDQNHVAQSHYSHRRDRPIARARIFAGIRRRKAHERAARPQNFGIPRVVIHCRG